MKQRLVMAGALVTPAHRGGRADRGHGPARRSSLKRIFRDLAAGGTVLCRRTAWRSPRSSAARSIIQRGRLIALGTVDELRAQAGREHQSTLEAVFLHLTGAEPELGSDDALSA
jgi:hypothetical protein